MTARQEAERKEKEKKKKEATAQKRKETAERKKKKTAAEEENQTIEHSHQIVVEARRKDMEKARQECRQRKIAKASPADNPVLPISLHYKNLPPQRRQRRRVLSENPDDFVLELPLPPSNPPPSSNPLPRPRRHANPQMQEASDPEIDDGYHEWAARENAKAE